MAARVSIPDHLPSGQEHARIDTLAGAALTAQAEGERASDLGDSTGKGTSVVISKRVDHSTVFGATVTALIPTGGLNSLQTQITNAHHIFN